MDHLRRNLEDGKEVIVIEGGDEREEAINLAVNTAKNFGG